MTAADPASVVLRLSAATNAHDIEGVIACFAPDYRNETPVHPERGFRGAAQVRTNWTQIFAAIPDVHTEIVRYVVDGPIVWSRVRSTAALHAPMSSARRTTCAA